MSITTATISAYDMNRYTSSYNIECRLNHPDAKLPKRANPTDAGADLYSCEDVTIAPGTVMLVDTGVAIKTPQNYATFIYNRSGQGSKGVMVANGVGVVDSDYRGNLKVALYNAREDAYIIHKGDRIAQLVVQRVELVNFVDSWNDTERGTGGFGSTGVN